MWTCPHCGKASEAESGKCPQCAVSLQDDAEDNEEGRRKPTADRERDFTPVQFKIWHVLTITALFALALAIYRLPPDPVDKIQLFAIVGSMGTIAALIAAIFGICRRG
jgi:hypothetical protein